MSTILNALKRLEDAGGANGGDQGTMPLRGPSVASGSKSRWRRMVVLAGLTILAGGGIFFGVFYDWPGKANYRNNAPPASPPVASGPAKSPPAPSAAPIPESPTEVVKREPRNNPDRIPLKSKSGMAVNSRTILTSPGYVPPNPEREGRKATSAAPLPGRARAAVSSSPSDLPSPTPMDSTPMPDATSPPGPAVPPPAHQDSYALTEVLARDALQLQAISWSDIPTARITIIAGRILREGQNVDGYAVVEIRPNDVIVQKAGKHWKLVYGGQ